MATSISSASSHVAKAFERIERLERAQRAADHGQRDVHAAGAAARPRAGPRSRSRRSSASRAPTARSARRPSGRGRARPSRSRRRRATQIGWKSARPEPLIGTDGQQRHALEQRDEARRRASRRSTARRSVCGTPDSATARSASALARMKRVRLCADALWARRRRSAPRRPARRPAPCATWRRAFSSSIDPPRLVADGGGEVDDGVDAAQRVAERRRVGEVAERDLHAHALGPEPPRVAHQAAHRPPGGGQARQQRGADVAGGAGEQDHAAGGPQNQCRCSCQGSASLW